MDYKRHLLVFDPAKFADTRVDVIGCGAVGSHIALQLAKLGVNNLHLWDGDVVEPHNLPNQFFTNKHVGQNKAAALAAHVREHSAAEPVAYEKHYTPGAGEELGRVVFVCVDSMDARKHIFESLRFSFGTDLLVETRMGNGEFRVYALRPTDALESERYLQTFYEDAESQESLCGAQITVIATVLANASFAVHRFLAWYACEFEDKEEAPQPFEWLVVMNPLTAIAN